MPVQILIADDNPSVRAPMRSVLESVDDDWKVIAAADGQEAVAKAKEFRPDLIILDLVMPRADGLYAAREISRLLPEIPILMHTLYACLEVEVKAAAAGVRRVVPKSESKVLVAAAQEALDPRQPIPLGYVSQASSADTASLRRRKQDNTSRQRRREDKIRELSAQLFALGRSKAHSPLLAELRDALHQHIEQLRARVADFPVVERRVRNPIAPSATAQEPAATAPQPVPVSAIVPEPPGKAPSPEGPSGGGS